MDALPSSSTRRVPGARREQHHTKLHLCEASKKRSVRASLIRIEMHMARRCSSNRGALHECTAKERALTSFTQPCRRATDARHTHVFVSLVVCEQRSVLFAKIDARSPVHVLLNTQHAMARVASSARGLLTHERADDMRRHTFTTCTHNTVGAVGTNTRVTGCRRCRTLSQLSRPPH